MRSRKLTKIDGKRGSIAKMSGPIGNLTCGTQFRGQNFKPEVVKWPFFADAQ